MSRYILLSGSGGGGSGVSSFNGRTGAVVPAAGDYNGLYIPVGAAVTSFDGRQGAVVPTAGDYDGLYIPSKATSGGAGQPSNAGTPRHCYGGFGTTGATTVAGSGDWSVSQSGTGVYVVTFGTAFTDTPAIELTPINASVAQFAVLAAYSTAGFTVNTFNLGGTAHNSEVHFCATAPS